MKFNLKEVFQPKFFGLFGKGQYDGKTFTSDLIAGIIVGIIALFAYNYLVARINKVMNMLEAKTMEFMDLLNEPAQ